MRYMAACLLGILAYPFLFQPWHVVHHHGDVQAEHSCEAGHRHLPSMPVGGLAVAEFSDDQCYICDFEIPANDLPVELELAGVPYTYTSFSPAIDSFEYTAEGYSLSNPRAPPAIS